LKASTTPHIKTLDIAKLADFECQICANNFVKSAFRRVTNDKYICGSNISRQTCRGCDCPEKQLRRNFRERAFSYIDPQKLAMVELPLWARCRQRYHLRPANILNVVGLAWVCWRWIKLSRKADRITALSQYGLLKVKCSTGRMVHTSVTFGSHAKSASSNAVHVRTKQTSTSKQ
jgi:hypothetical protein